MIQGFTGASSSVAGHSWGRYIVLHPSYIRPVDLAHVLPGQHLLAEDSKIGNDLLVLQTQRANLQEVGGLLLDMFTGKYLFEVVRARMSPGRNMKVA